MKVSLCSIALLTFSLFLSGLVIAAPPDGLVFLMNFDEGSGGDVNDLSGFENDGTIEGKIDWVDGKFDGGLNLDGATYVTVPNANPLSELTHPNSSYSLYEVSDTFFLDTHNAWMSRECKESAPSGSYVGSNPQHPSAS